MISETLMAADTSVGVNECSRTLGMPKSTVSRFLATMESLGFVRRDQESRKFSLGLRLFELGCKAIDDTRFRKIEISQMENLRDTIDENALLTVLEGTQIIYLENIWSRQAVVIQNNVGGTTPAYCVSSGKAMLAYKPDRLKKVTTQGLKPYTPLTIVDPDKLRLECTKIRERGYAINREEFRKDVTGVAAPIFDERGETVGAISTSTPHDSDEQKPLE